MATLTLSKEFSGIWPPDSLSGGTITSSSATTMRYTSDAGYTVTLTGTNLAYDASGLPAQGIVTGLTIQKAGVTYATLTGISVDFARAGLWIFGFDDGSGAVNPDPFGFMNNALRGDDVVNGHAGYDDIMAGSGNDIIYAGNGNDWVNDQDGSDTMDGGDGWDTLSYAEANWDRSSYKGIFLDADSGHVEDPWGNLDDISGFEEFRDTHYGDQMWGSELNEDFWLNRGNDFVNGRGGYDWLMYADAHRSGATRGITVDMATGTIKDSWGGTDQFEEIEGIRGTKFKDTFTGSGGDDNFNGGQGQDTFYGGTGVDALSFWSVGWNSDGGHGVTVDLNLATEVVDDGYGNAENANSFEELNGSRFADKFTGNAAANFLWGDEGNDTLAGGAGNDTIFGDAQRDSISGSDGDDFLVGGTASDILSGGTGADTFAFTGTLKYAGVDTLTYFSSADRILIDSDWGGGFVSDTLVANQFRSGAGVTTANSATQRFIYNTTTGDLYFDEDGSASKAAIKIATITNKPVLTFADIEIWF